MANFAVVFVHGLAKKPPVEKLEEIWRWGLSREDAPPPFDKDNAGIDLNTEGVHGIFNYWADVFYGKDVETEFHSYYESEKNAVVQEGTVARVAGELKPPAPANAREQEFLWKFEEKMLMQPTPPEPPGLQAAPDATEAAQLEIASWLPGPVKEALIKKAAMEAYYFLFRKHYTNPDGKTFEVRKELRQRLLDKIALAKTKADKVVLVTHSMGTMIAYDVVRNCPQCPEIDTLLTLGSPLGVTEVQTELRAEGLNQVDFPPKVARWINVYDPLDPVCGADPKFNDYVPYQGRHVEDVKESNWGSWRHTITHYFAGKQFRAKFAEAVGVDRG